MKRCLSLLAGAVALALLSACQTTKPKTEWIPPFTPAMQTPQAFKVEEIAAVRRVALLPTWGGNLVRETELAQVDAAVRRALQRLNQFEVIVVSREDLRGRFGEEAFSASGMLPATLLSDVAEVTAADAILFLEVTSISSYPPLNLGLKARLEHLPQGGTLWAFDHYFDAGMPEVAEAAHRASQPTDPSAASVLLSPSRFAYFVTTVMVETMRIPAQNARKH